MKLINGEIWESSNCLYIKTFNDVLLKFTGEDVDKVKLVINCVLSQSKLPSNSDVSKSELLEIFALLRKLNIIQECQQEQSCPSKIGIYADTSSLIAIKSRLPHFDIEAIQDTKKLTDYNLLVIVSPFNPNHISISEIGYSSYQYQVPLLFCEFSVINFTIGPLVLPKEHTPSLNCYLKRRAVNAKSPKLFIEMITQPSKPLSKLQCDDYHYHEMYLTLLCEEISRFIEHDGVYSKHLVGMSITTNFMTYEIEKSRILKDPLSKLFTKTPFIPFNG